MGEWAERVSGKTLEDTYSPEGYHSAYTLQFYQGGFRPLDGEGSLHGELSGKALQPVVVPGSVSANNKNGITCGNGVGGARLADCLNILGR